MRKFIRFFSIIIVIPVITLIGLCGCRSQTKIIENRHWQLNDAILKTGNEQLLLNLVRLRYDETPYFLQIASITTTFSAGASLGASGTFPEGEASNVLGVEGGVTYSESPSVTWSIPDSREFLTRFYAPVGADQLTVLTQAGFGLEDVFRIGVQRMNRLRNKEFSFRDGEFVPESYSEFVETIELMEILRKEGLLDFAYALMTNYGGVPVPISQIDTRSVADGVPIGLLYLSREPGMATPYQVSKPLYLRFTKESDLDPRTKRLRLLLNLDPDLYSFPITNAVDVSPEGIRAVDGKLAQVYEPDVKLAHIALNNRSVINILRFASATVEVPETDIDRGIARPSSTRLDQYLVVRSSAKEPSDAWLKVREGGTWFYIPESDLNARNSFTLLSALFASVVGEVPGGKPVLTLPVK
jgi:hypothetical protein